MATIQESDLFEEALATRQGRIAYRLGFAALLACPFSIAVGPVWAAGWFVVYAALQILDQRMLRWRASLPEARRLRIVVLPCISLAVSNVTFSGLALPAPAHDGPWGVLAFGFLVMGIGLYSIMAVRASKWAFLSIFIPLVLGLLALPALAWMQGGGITAVAITLSGSFLTLYAALLHWRGSAAVRTAELMARQRAEAGDAAKTRFLAMVSHDLRTPLMAIRAGAERLSRDKDGPSADDARLIEDAAVMMRRLLDDLLDMFKTEAGQMAIASEPTDLRTLCGDLIRFWQPTAIQKGLTLQLDDDANAPDWALSDTTRLRQILNNLLSNALKFTPSGHVTLSLRQTGDLLKLIVSDTGRGLSPQDQAALFQPYVQGAEGTAQGEGTGLGLVISRELARAMGGDLTLSSTPGQGAAFTLSVACVPCARPEVSDVATLSADLSILIVDDHPINRKALALMLEGVARDPVFAGSGEEALTLLAQQPFDLVLMDVNMPGLDGWATTRRLRATVGPNAAVPVIAVTGSTSDADVAHCRVAGMDGWVAKPIGAADLFAEIDRVLTVAEKACADAA